MKKLLLIAAFTFTALPAFAGAYEKGFTAGWNSYWHAHGQPFAPLEPLPPLHFGDSYQDGVAAGTLAAERADRD